MVDESDSSETATSEERAQFMAALNARRSATRRENATTIKHNGINRDLYEARLKAEIAGNVPLIEQKHSDREIILRREEEWFNIIGDRWRDACLQNISDPNAVSVLDDRLKRHRSGNGLNRTSILIAGKMGRGKTYLGYAYAYELIHAGLLKPSEVFIGTEQDLVKIARGGFHGAEMLEDLLKPQHRFYLFDDIGRTAFPDDIKRRELWHALVDNIYSNGKTLVITTNLPIQEKQGVLAAWVGNSSESRIRHITGDGVVFMDGDNKREEIGDRLESDWRKRAGK